MHNNPAQAASGGLSPETIDAAARGALKASPGGAVVAWNYILGMPVEKWVSLAVLVFTVLQIVVLVRREFIKRKEAQS
jgi:hypothetical protein